MVILCSIEQRRIYTPEPRMSYVADTVWSVTAALVQTVLLSNHSIRGI